ncbi:MAG: hypothetical protein HQL95_10565 [Magnetococcales bacterium]|nr:hypothetical protein [Magnetococcales bacterium]
MTVSEATPDVPLGTDAVVDQDEGKSGQTLTASFEKISVGARKLGEQARANAKEIGGKATSAVKDLAENEAFVQNGLAVSLAATVLTSVKGLNMRQYHPYTGAALVGFAMLHLWQNKKKRDKRVALCRQEESE